MRAHSASDFGESEAGQRRLGAQAERESGSASSSEGRAYKESFSDGDHVFHKTFGEGMVINVIGGIATVAFKDAKVGIKKLALTIAPLEKI